MKKETQLSVLKEIRDLLKLQKVDLTAFQEGTAIFKQPSDYRTVHISKGMTIEGVLAECQKLFLVWRYTEQNLDERVTSDRTSEASYSIKFKNVQEADDDMQNKSASDLKGVKTITLLERLVMELDYFKETGKHLDIENWTLCAGSRRSDGSVPYVYWHDDKLYVDCASVDGRSADLRARVAVS